MEGTTPSCTYEAPSFPSPTKQPVNGFDGSLHGVIFYAPSYRESPSLADPFSTALTWTVIDAYGSRVAVWTMGRGIGLGLVLITLLHVLFSTPHTKRWKPFHSCLLTALLFKTVHLFATCTQAWSPNVGFNPAYRTITKDYTQTYSSTFVAWTLSRALLDLLATTFTLACLFIQAKTSLAGMRLSHRPWYFTLNTYLILASIACVLARILMITSQTLTFYPAHNSPTRLNLAIVSNANTTTNSLALGSYCLVALGSVLHILWTRRKLLLHSGGGGGRNTRYDRALSLLALVLLESFILPLLLILLFALPVDKAWFLSTEAIVLPCILALLPFGGLLSETGRQDGGVGARVLLPLRQNGFGLRDGRVGNDADAAAADAAPPGRPLKSGRALPAADRELAALDAL